MIKGVKVFLLLFLSFVTFSFQNSFALSLDYDFSNSADYSISNSSDAAISGGMGYLTEQYNHEGSIVDGTNSALLNQTQAIQVVGNYAYMTTRTSNALEIINIANPANPNHVGSIADGGSVMLRRAQDLVIDGNYAYITALRDDAVQIVDISNPASPTHVSNIRRSGTIQLNGAIGIEKQGNYLYVASQVDDALEIIDVSNPATPVHVAALEDATRLNGAEDIKISGNYAYVTAETAGRLQIIDISNPASPTFVAEVTNGQNGALLGGASGITISGNYAYIAANSSDAIQVIDISNPASPVVMGNISNGGTTLLNGPENIVIDGTKAYVASTVSDAIEVIDISDPSAPAHITALLNGGSFLLNGAMDIQKVGDYIYVASDTSDALEIISAGGYALNSPFITPNSALTYSGSIDLVTPIFGSGNQGSVTYQISKDNGVTWYYLNGSTWTITTSGVIHSNTTTEIHSEIQTFNGLAGGIGEFLWKAFLTGSGSQKVEVENIKIDYTTAGINETIDFESPGGYSVTQGIWTRVTTDKYEGIYSIEADNGGVNNSTSCFELTRDIYSDSTVSFYRKVSSEGGYDFLRFYINGAVQDSWSGEIAWGQESYELGAGTTTFEWCYEKDFSVSSGSDTAWVDFIEIVEDIVETEIPVLDFEVAGGYSVTTTVTGTNTDWTRQTIEVYEGAYAIESQNQTDNTTACFERVQTVGVLDTGISFYKKVSSEASYDFLEFYIDGVLQDSWAGENDWSKETYSLSPASYTLRWCYAKDGSVSNGSDTAWVDLVSVTQDPPIITEVTSVQTPTNDHTPDYTFYSPVSGAISYSGSCSSSSHTTASIGNNTITFDSLGDGIYTDCYIQVLASPQNSNSLHVSNFTIDSTGIDISINYPSDGNTIPSSSFTIDITYTDENGINATTADIELFKWNGSSYGPDIASSYIDFGSSTVTASQALYPTSALDPAAQYKVHFSIEDTIGNNSESTSVFYIANGDSIPPIVTQNFPGSGSLLPNADFNLDLTYSDDSSGVNTGSLSVALYKWDGSVWGANIAGTYVDTLGATISSTGAVFPVTKMGYGKYKFISTLEDNNGNSTSLESEFYIDEPLISVSVPEADLGDISYGSEYFSGEIEIIVQTVGAQFDVLLDRNGDFSDGTNIIQSWDGLSGYGYDQDVYTNSISTIHSAEIIASQGALINTDGEYNSYSFKIKIGALIEEQQTAGDYEGNINFALHLNY